MAFMCLLLGFLTLLSSLQTSLSGPLQTGIHGGSDASPTEFPYVVSITLIDNHDCGGAILTEKYVLSAAHCFRFPLDKYKVIAGEYDLASDEGNEQVREIKQVTQHPNFRIIKYFDKPQARNDIAIVELKSNFNLNGNVQAIQLPQLKQNFTGNAIVSGWGSSSENGPMLNILQKADLKILSDKECRAYYYGIADEEICAEGDGESKVACYGDSGSPLAQNGVVIGIVSGSVNCISPVPTVFTEVSAYIEWINQIID